MPRNSILMGGVAAVLAVALVAASGWYFFIRGDEPPPVSLAEAVSSVASPTATAEGGSTGDASATATETETATEAVTGVATTSASGSADTGATGDLTGTWTVDGANSFVGYRIDEELASIGSTTAVGRTSDVEGSLEFDGETITTVSILANLQGLTSDDSRRDGQLRRQALETNQFPEATFVLTEPIVVDGDPASGAPIAATAVGDLTIHGVTNRVEMALEGQFVEDRVIVVGSTVILLADYDIDKPEAMSVLSVSEEATMEMQLVFTRA